MVQSRCSPLDVLMEGIPQLPDDEEIFPDDKALADGVGNSLPNFGLVFIDPAGRVGAIADVSQLQMTAKHSSAGPQRMSSIHTMLCRCADSLRR
jgi:hypothetical protein